MTLKELKALYTTKSAEMRSLHESTKDADWTGETRSKWEAMRTELAGIKEKIEREEELRDNDQSFVEERARREKEEAVAAERRRQEESEAARLVEEQRKAEEEARRAADKEHRRTVNRRVIADLIAQGIPEEFAQKALLAIAGGKVQDAHIKY